MEEQSQLTLMLWYCGTNWVEVWRPTRPHFCQGPSPAQGWYNVLEKCLLMGGGVTKVLVWGLLFCVEKLLINSLSYSEVLLRWKKRNTAIRRSKSSDLPSMCNKHLHLTTKSTNQVWPRPKCKCSEWDDSYAVHDCEAPLGWSQPSVFEMSWIWKKAC